MQPKQPPIWFGRYLLLKPIATGGMGEVHLAKLIGSHGYEKLVVIKRLLNSRQSNKKYVDMFFNEARLAAQLNHSRIVQVFDAGEIEQIPFMAMEYVAGKSLRKLLDTMHQQHKLLSFHHVIDVFAQICDGLAFAHQAEHFSGAPLGLIHRDINPHNLLISYFGEIKVIDFGIAKSDLDSEQTVVGTIKGTVSYMSPEQSLGQRLDKRSDIYSLGICLYEALTGNNPFQKESLEASLLAIQQSIVPPLALMRSEAMLFQPVLDNMLTVDPNHRFERADQCAAMLRSIQLPPQSNHESLAHLMQRLFEQALLFEATRLEALGAKRALEEIELTINEASRSITPTQIVSPQSAPPRQRQLEVTLDLNGLAKQVAASNEQPSVLLEQSTAQLPVEQELSEIIQPAGSSTPHGHPSHWFGSYWAQRQHIWRKWHQRYPMANMGLVMLIGMLLGYGLEMVHSAPPAQPTSAPQPTPQVSSLAQQRDGVFSLEEKPELKVEELKLAANANDNHTDTDSKAPTSIDTETKAPAINEELAARKSNRLLRNVGEGKGLFQLLLESNQEIVLSLDGRQLNTSLVRSNKASGKVTIKDRTDPTCTVQLSFANSNPLRLQLFGNGQQLFDVRDSAGQKIGTIGALPYDINCHKRPINLGLILVERGGTCQLRLFFREPER